MSSGTPSNEDTELQGVAACPSHLVGVQLGYCNAIEMLDVEVICTKISFSQVTIP
jgi:hypothetical protein